MACAWQSIQAIDATAVRVSRIKLRREMEYGDINEIRGKFAFLSPAGYRGEKRGWILTDNGETAR